MYRILGQTRFNLHHGAVPVNAGRFHSLLDRNGEIDYSAEYLGNSRPYALAAAAADDHCHRLIFQEQGWRHHGRDTLPRGAGMKSCRMQVILTHHVVEHNTCARYKVSRSFTV